MFADLTVNFDCGNRSWIFNDPRWRYMINSVSVSV